MQSTSMHKYHRLRIRKPISEATFKYTQFEMNAYKKICYSKLETSCGIYIIVCTDLCMLLWTYLISNLWHYLCGRMEDILEKKKISYQTNCIYNRCIALWAKYLEFSRAWYFYNIKWVLIIMCWMKHNIFANKKTNYLPRWNRTDQII